jgi:glycosyltransferase involved in cell wall biosynthesis
MKNTDPVNEGHLVSVIIPCYNHGRFLADAIESVRQQRYSPLEIIVVDDGSSDNTREVATRFENVKYVYQQNAGLSAARNAGIDASKGSHLVFLDADDILYPEAVKTNLEHLLHHPQHAFVSGWHDKVDERKHPIRQDSQEVVTENHYVKLLQGNYIGMHATVMYQRWALNDFRFDPSLKACEDYDLYLRIARKYPVGNHAAKIAAYRMHGQNMSGNIPFMLRHVLLVLERQQPVLADETEKKAYRDGKTIWGEYYSALIYKNLSRDVGKNASKASEEELKILGEYKPSLLTRYRMKRTWLLIKEQMKKRLPDVALKVLFKKGYFNRYTPPVGKINSGDFERATPFSFDFGFDRGGAIDRYYIESFLEVHKNFVRGRALEIGDNEYTMKYGGTRITQSDILHVDATNSRATFIGDLTDVPQISDETFDCIVLTQTLHLIYDFRAAIRTCYRLLKPGGSLLLTVPGISHIDHGEWGNYWLWSFTDKSMIRIMNEVFPDDKIAIKTYGNVYVAAAFLYGMGLPEFKKQYLEIHDPSYQVIISVVAHKP